MIPRQQSAFILGTLVLACCADVMALAQNSRATLPDTKAIVLRYLRSEPIPAAIEDTGSGPGDLFNDPKKLGIVELSRPTWVQHPTLGWTWLACLRTHPLDRPVGDYALFIGTQKIRDARLSVV